MAILSHCYFIFCMSAVSGCVLAPLSMCTSVWSFIAFWKSAAACFLEALQMSLLTLAMRSGEAGRSVVLVVFLAVLMPNICTLVCSRPVRPGVCCLTLRAWSAKIGLPNEIGRRRAAQWYL